MSNQVTLIDAGTGNLRSVYKGLESLGAQVLLTSDPKQIAQAGRVVLPGVGAFGDFMKGLRARGLEIPILEFYQRGNPLLGICVGMQAFFEVGREMGEHRGLGFLSGQVLHFPAFEKLKVPHTGWNQLWPQRNSLLLRAIDAGEYAYFNHSFYCEPGEAGAVLACTDYGINFASAVQRGNLYGVQFHPEKSQRVGLKILNNFLRYA
jgi:glutamine amidotransferase